VNSDPHDGFWNFEGNSAEPTTPWDEIFAGITHSSNLLAGSIRTDDRCLKVPGLRLHTLPSMV
jgi:hypothetical protein